MSGRYGSFVVGLVALVAVLATFYLLSSREASLRCGALTLESGSAAFSSSGWRVELTGAGGFRCVFLDTNGSPVGSTDVGWPIPGM